MKSKVQFRVLDEDEDNYKIEVTTPKGKIIILIPNEVFPTDDDNPYGLNFVTTGHYC